MTISVLTRRDVVVVDPERFVAAARQALRDLDPELTEAGPPRRSATCTTPGLIQQIVLDEPMPLQDYGCFLPEDLFTSRR